MPTSDGDDGRKIYKTRRKRKRVPQSLLRRYEPLLWTWVVDAFKDSKHFPVAAREPFSMEMTTVAKLRLMPYWSALPNEIQARLELTQEERAYGEKLEGDQAHGDLADRRSRFVECLERLNGKGCDIERVCGTLAWGKTIALNYYDRDRMNREHRDWLNEHLAALEGFLPVADQISTSRHSSPSFVELAERLPEELQRLKRENAGILRSKPRGRPRNEARPWRELIESKLIELSVGEDERRELIALLGLAKLRT